MTPARESTWAGNRENAMLNGPLGGETTCLQHAASPNQFNASAEHRNG